MFYRIKVILDYIKFRMVIVSLNNTARIHSYLLSKTCVLDGVKIYVSSLLNVVVHAQYVLGDSGVKNKQEAEHF